MFADLLNRLTRPEPEQLPDEDARLALTALLIRVARADHHYDASEKAQIEGILATRYGLGAEGRATLMQEAEILEAEAPDTVRFTRAIKDGVAYEDRLGVVKALWSVVLADGFRSDEENALLRLVVNLLGISDKDSALARQQASRRG